MNILEIIIVSLSLSMDSFATAICKGMEIKKGIFIKALIISLWFAIFQTLMPILGFFLGNLFTNTLFDIDHYLSLIILSFLGINMIKDSKENTNFDDSLKFTLMILLSISISIDAFTIGITYSFLKLNIIINSLCNFIITYITTFLGVNLGNFFGKQIGTNAKIIGGLVLIALGIKIFITHILN